jgi:alkanesulfonate monooxygenase SsuD/methylene tetrahydromethanopterin reductase-like flavin-dependent oxidoreductase (luciferase family)
MKLKIGVYVPMYGTMIRGTRIDPEPSFAYAREVTLLAEKLGLHSVWAPDHLLNPMLGEPARALEAWTVIVALAAVTRHIKLGHTTLCQAFRYPAVLAKMITTLDDICQGRFICSLGAGWYKREFEAYGLPWDDHQGLIARGSEQITILKQLWTTSEVDFQGKYYQLERCTVEPKPVQRPHPPIWWAGNSPESQKVAAEQCDGWLMGDNTPEGAKENIQGIQALLAGREIEYALSCHLVVEDSDQKAQARLRTLTQGDERVFSRILSQGLIGAPETIAQKLSEYERAGIGYVLLKPAPALEGLAAFGEEVLSHLETAA